MYTKKDTFSMNICFNQNKQKCKLFELARHFTFLLCKLYGCNDNMSSFKIR